jgi:predicted HicB family RNase H-like nuclease
MYLTASSHSPIVTIMKVLTVRIPEELHRQFKIKCVTEGSDMNKVLTKLIETYVKGSKGKAK